MNAPFAQTRAVDCNTWVGRIYLAGDFDEIRAAVRAFCSEQGACFCVAPASYIYSGGEESGAVVTLINYPRFAHPPEALEHTLESLANHLLSACHQGSLTVETPEFTRWITRRRGES